MFYSFFFPQSSYAWCKTIHVSIYFFAQLLVYIERIESFTTEEDLQNVLILQYLSSKIPLQFKNKPFWAKANPVTGVQIVTETEEIKKLQNYCVAPLHSSVDKFELFKYNPASIGTNEKKMFLGWIWGMFIKLIVNFRNCKL